MSKWACMIVALVAPLSIFADDPPKDEKKPIRAFTDPTQAGPDFAIQGEYLGSHAGSTFGVQVIAEGDGLFHMKGFRGGLPGDGWNGETKDIKEWSGKLEDGK